MSRLTIVFAPLAAALMAGAAFAAPPEGAGPPKAEEQAAAPINCPMANGQMGPQMRQHMAGAGRMGAGQAGAGQMAAGQMGPNGMAQGQGMAGGRRMMGQGGMMAGQGGCPYATPAAAVEPDAKADAPKADAPN